jgi:NAD(P)-dependent dehydrogenase (short-subunit alcohol dehydrogenase family)
MTSAVGSPGFTTVSLVSGGNRGIGREVCRHRVLQEEARIAVREGGGGGGHPGVGAR